jgi:diguanylate cyclase
VVDLNEQLKGAEGLAFARDTVELMARHHVSPTPEHYQIWLAYRLGGLPELNNAIDTLVESGAPMSEQISRTLFDRFFAGDASAAQVLITSEQIAKELSGVLAILETAGEKTGSFGDTLTQAVASLEKGVDARGLQDLMATLATSTRDMAAHNHRLNEQLMESSNEITTLRSSLAQARSESVTDGLTGLANRRYFDEVFRMRVKEAADHGLPLCLLMVDIDHFKRFNDTWGHPTGDQVIRFVAAALQGLSMPDQLIARYGGEEFAVVLPRKHATAGVEFAEHARRLVEGKKLLRKSTNEALGRVTISCGVAEIIPGEEGASLLHRADQALYISKREGRNRVTVAASNEPGARVA